MFVKIVKLSYLVFGIKGVRVTILDTAKVFLGSASKIDSGSIEVTSKGRIKGAVEGKQGTYYSTASLFAYNERPSGGYTLNFWLAVASSQVYAKVNAFVLESDFTPEERDELVEEIVLNKVNPSISKYGLILRRDESPLEITGDGDKKAVKYWHCGTL